jgi:hypothetical protein
MPPTQNAACRYLTGWTETKLLWGRTADQNEIDAINVYTSGPCEKT